MAQAEITWGKAIKEVVDWLERHGHKERPSMYGEIKGVNGTVFLIGEDALQAKLKEWEIE